MQATATGVIPINQYKVSTNHFLLKLSQIRCIFDLECLCYLTPIVLGADCKLFMKPVAVLIILIIGLFSIFLGYALIKSDRPRTAEEVRMQLQLDDDKQEHEVKIKELDLNRDLALNQQQLNYQAYLQQQTLNRDVQLEQLRIQRQLATEQWELDQKAQAAQRQQQAEIALKQIESTTKYTLNQQKLSADNTQLGMKLTHDAAMQQQKAASIENRIYLASGAGIAIILVLSGSGAALFFISRRSKVELMRLQQAHQYRMEERHLTHEVRMKVLDVITQFSSEERAEIVGKLVNTSTALPPDTTIVLNPRQTEPSLGVPPATSEPTTANKHATPPTTPNQHRLPRLALRPVHDSKRVIGVQLHQWTAQRHKTSPSNNPTT